MFIQALRHLRAAKLGFTPVTAAPPSVPLRPFLPPVRMPTREELARDRRVEGEAAQLDEFTDYAAAVAQWAHRRADGWFRRAEADPLRAMALEAIGSEMRRVAVEVSNAAARIDGMRHALCGPPDLPELYQGSAEE